MDAPAKPVPVYQIVDWDKHFENSRSREIDCCRYVAIPNKQHGMGVTAILCQPDGAAIYGIWQLIVGACSQQKRPRQGWLTADGLPTGRPWTADEMAARWRRPPSEVQRALDFISGQHKVNWIAMLQSTADQLPTNCRPCDDEVSTDCRPTAVVLQEGIEGKEGNLSCSEPQAASEPKGSGFQFTVNANNGSQWECPQGLIDGYRTAYPGVNVPGECRKAEAWLLSNKSRRKTPRGMARFLNGWMERAQNGGKKAKPSSQSDTMTDDEKVDALMATLVVPTGDVLKLIQQP